jgi:uncharacterized protein (TIGR02453 family)
VNPCFKGFSRHTLDFLVNLGVNNNKAWFEAHRKQYEEHVLAPLKDLVSDLSGTMLVIDPDLVTIPAVDRTISSIYRDTRFSHDKSFYKTCLWITFKRQIKEWKESPCFFFEITADSYRYGVGFYSAAKETMDRLRCFIDRKSVEFQKVVAIYKRQGTFVLEGEVYKKPLNPALSESLQQWYQRRNLYMVCNRDADARLFSRLILVDLREGFTILAPLYDFLWKVKSG